MSENNYIHGDVEVKRSFGGIFFSIRFLGHDEEICLPRELKKLVDVDDNIGVEYEILPIGQRRATKVTKNGNTIWKGKLE
ncbi:MAG: hypothetical protein PHT40_00400 [Patescibacteria group bacterium]|nr:hypothetical protein [Patescibacteria group bacterium]